MSEREYLRLTTVGKLETGRRVLMDLIETMDLIDQLGIASVAEEKEAFQGAYRATDTARDKLTRDTDGDE